MGSAGSCPRVPSGGSSAQLRHRERSAGCCSAPWRWSGSRARAKEPNQVSLLTGRGRRELLLPPGISLRGHWLGGGGR